MEYGLLYFVSLFGYGLFYKCFFKKMKLGACIFSGFCTMVVFAYVFVGLLGLYGLGPRLVMGFGYLFFFVGIISYLLRNNGEINYKSFLNPAFLTFVILVFAAAVLLKGAVLKNHDAYSFWARSVKEMYTYRTSYFNAFTNIPHTDYNFAIPTLQYSLMCQFGWRDCYLQYVLVSGVISCICLVVDKFERQLLGALAFVTLCVIFYPLLSTGFSIYSLMIDGILGLCFFCGLFSYYTRKDNSLYSFVPTVAAAAILPLLKMYTGILFAAVICAAVIVEKLWKRWRNGDRKTAKNSVLIVMVLLVVFAEFSWRIYYNYNFHQKQIAIDIEVNKHLNEINDDKDKPIPLAASEHQYDLRWWEYIAGNRRTKKSMNVPKEERIEKMISGLRVAKQKMLGPIQPGFKINYIALASIMFAAFLLMVFISDKDKRNYLLKVFCGLGVGGIIYLIGYVVTFYVQPGVEGETLRYLGMVTIPFAFLTFFGVCHGFSLRKRGLVQGVLAIALGGILIVTTTGEYYKGVYLDKTPFMPAVYTDKVLANIKDYLLVGKNNLILDNTKYNWRYGPSGVCYSYAYNALPNRLSAIYYKSTDKNAGVAMKRLKDTVESLSSRLFISVINGKVQDDLSKFVGMKLWPGYVYVFDVRYKSGKYYYKYVDKIKLNIDINF